MSEFEQIYKKYSPVVYKYVLSLGADESLSEDITAETFLKAIKNISSYDERCKMSTWLCTIAKNTYFSYLRKKDNNSLPLDDECYQVQDEGLSPEKIIENEELRSIIYQAMIKLTSPYKDVAYLRLFADLSFSDIGSLFNKNESWARVTYHRARKLLKGMIEYEI